MENPKAVNRFLVGLLVSVIVIALAVSIYLRDFSVVLFALGFIFLLFIGFAVVALTFAIEFGPVMWLLSWLSSRRLKRKS
ncbi:MAG: hypothetical protein PCFJNLEI_04092 [Verrucomicrobiae bacterium]|nr:hypothetical protein [Verrucomicrobiae bacterium]